MPVAACLADPPGRGGPMAGGLSGDGDRGGISPPAPESQAGTEARLPLNLTSGPGGRGPAASHWQQPARPAWRRLKLPGQHFHGCSRGISFRRALSRKRPGPGGTREYADHGPAQLLYEKEAARKKMFDHGLNACWYLLHVCGTF